MDYSNAKVYKILNGIDEDVYVGATCQSLSQRMAGHRRSMKATNKKHYKLYQKMIELGVENFYIELIRETPCENAEQLRAIEGEYIRQCKKYGNLNVRVEGRTKQEYTEDNKEKKVEYDRKRREEKGEELLQQKRDYYQNDIENQREKHKTAYAKVRENKETCSVCGGVYIPWGRKRHLSSKKHQEALNKDA